MTLTLYKLTEAYQLLLETEADAGAGSFEEALLQLGGEINAKAESLAKVIRSLEAESDVIEAEIKRLREKKDSRDTRVMWIKNYLQRNMEAAGIERVNGAMFSVALQASPPSCQVEDPASVPAVYQVVAPATIRVDNRAIIAHWKASGQQVPGAVVSQGKHVRIW